MLRPFRLAIAWLLFLALPLQAVASAFQLPCCVELMTVPATATASCHEQEVTPEARLIDGQSDVTVAASPPHDADGALQEHAGCTCLDCMGNGMGTNALPSLITAYSKLPQSSEHLRNTSAPFVGFMPDRLHRPPRTV